MVMINSHLSRTACFTCVADPMDDCTAYMHVKNSREHVGDCGVRGLVRQALAEERQGNSDLQLFEDIDETSTVTGGDSYEVSLDETILPVAGHQNRRISNHLLFCMDS